MSELIFNRVDHKEHNALSINVENALISVTEEDYNIIEIQKTKFGYKKATMRINNQDLINKMKFWEKQINDYLKSEGIEPISLFYGNRIYPIFIYFFFIRK